MNVGELIKLLQAYSPDAQVVVQGYEEGFDDITVVTEIAIQPSGEPKWYYGRFEKTDPKESTGSKKAVLLFSRGRSDG